MSFREKPGIYRGVFWAESPGNDRLLEHDAGAHYLLGCALRRKRDSQEALQQYRAAYQLNPLDPDYRKACERLLGAAHD